MVLTKYHAELAQRLKSENPPFILDVRGVGEYRVGHLPEAVHIPHTELAERIDELDIADGVEVVVYTTVTSKGQLTLPKALRDKLQLAPGDRIEFRVDDDDTVRLVVKRNSIRRLKGMLAKPKNPVSLNEMEEAIEKGGGRF